MCQPRKWLWGLLPLLLLAILAGYWHQSDVESDLSKKGSAALAAAGLGWGKVQLSGRDAVISGEAPSPDAKTQALKVAEAVEGVRRAGDATTLLAEAKPFTFTALRDTAKITLSGFVPNAAARDALIEAAKKAAPGASVVDETRIARGAAADFGALGAYGLAQLGRLSQGTLSLSDNVLSVTGRAANSDQFTAIRSALGTLPAGAKLAKGLGAGDILAPLAKPFTFEAVRGPAGIELSGFVPSPEARVKLLAEIKAMGGVVKDTLKVADGAPAGDWAGSIGLGLRELAKLESGKLSAVDDKLNLVGKAREGITADSIRSDLKGLPQGFGLGQLAIEERAPPPPPPTPVPPPVAATPFTFTALRGDKVLTLTGIVPDEKAKTDLVEAAKRLFEGDRIDDQLTVGAVSREGLAPALAGLQALSRLTSGAQLSLKGQEISLKGLALFDAARDQVAADFKRIVPPGFNGSAELGTAQVAGQVGAAECQALFTEILSSGTIRFRIASAQLSDESRGILDKLAVVAQRCGNARVQIGGHTDADGAPATNAELSRRRAEAVALYFTQAGIPAARLEPVGFGETQPLVPNDSAANKARNRRIEFVVK